MLLDLKPLKKTYLIADIREKRAVVHIAKPEGVVVLRNVEILVAKPAGAGQPLVNIPNVRVAPFALAMWRAVWGCNGG